MVYNIKKAKDMKKPEVTKQPIFRKCLCDTPKCGKCLTIHCEEPNCSIHTPELKKWYRRLNPDRFTA